MVLDITITVQEPGVEIWKRKNHFLVCYLGLFAGSEYLSKGDVACNSLHATYKAQMALRIMTNKYPP